MCVGHRASEGGKKLRGFGKGSSFRRLLRYAPLMSGKRGADRRRKKQEKLRVERGMMECRGQKARVEHSAGKEKVRTITATGVTVGKRMEAGMSTLQKVRERIQEAHRGTVSKKQAKRETSKLLDECYFTYLDEMHGEEAMSVEDRRSILQWMKQVQAPGTQDAYAAAFRRVMRWSAEQPTPVGVLPLSPVAMARYLVSLSEYCESKKLSRSNVDTACAAVNFFHKQAGLKSPGETELIKNLRKGMGRKLGERGQQKLPLLSEDLKAMYEDRIGEKMEDAPIRAIMMMLRVALGVHGLMRTDDEMRVTFGDVIILDTHARVFVWESKTDSRRTGQWVIVPYNPEKWSAYQLLMTAAEAWQREWNGLEVSKQVEWGLKHPEAVTVKKDGSMLLALNEVPIMCALQRFGGRMMPAREKKQWKHWTYSTYSKELKEWINGIGLNAAKYGTHSARRGGATELKEMGLPDEVVMAAGRWKSLKSMQRYIDWNVDFTLRAREVLKARGHWEQAVESRVRDSEVQRSVGTKGLEWQE